MIGNALKELVVGVFRFARYRMARLTGLPRSSSLPNEDVNPRTPASASNAAMLSALPDPPLLSDSYKRSITLSTSRRDLEGEESARNPVYQIWKQRKPRAHKWTHYFEAYHAIFGPRQLQDLRILEIGIDKGASLRLWRQYFENPATVIVGVDIDAACSRFDSSHENVHVRIGSQDDAIFLDAVTREFGPFDIIIDDGSHVSSHMIASFNHLFAGALKEDGIYVAEDLHANYWLPWRDTRRGFLDLCKELMEVMHVHYTRATFAPWLREHDSDSDSGRFSLDLPVIATMIREIRIFDSIVAIYKTRRLHLPRVLNPLAD